MNLSFSTSWCNGSIERLHEVLPAVDGFEIGSRGTGAFFRGVEELVRSEALPVTSVHALAWPGKEEHDSDYAPRFAALDKTERAREVDRLSRSAEWAAGLGARSLVIHIGRIEDNDLKELHRAYKEKVRRGNRDASLFDQVVSQRTAVSGEFMKGVAEGVDILCARFSEIDICPETRIHYYEIPTPEELDTLFTSLDHPNLGYWHDIGHTFNLDALGFVPLSLWQEKFGDRCRGVHIHDVDSMLHDHFPPGDGSADLARILELFDPERVSFTLEIVPAHDTGSVLRGIEHLRRLEQEEELFSPDNARKWT
jgi:sugar phosphate isomerase/epimerase